MEVVDLKRQSRHIPEHKYIETCFKYFYCINNPLRYVDPTELVLQASGTEEEMHEIYETISEIDPSSTIDYETGIISQNEDSEEKNEHGSEFINNLLAMII